MVVVAVAVAVGGEVQRWRYLHLREARRSKRRIRLVHSPFHSKTMERSFNSIPARLLLGAVYFPLLVSSKPPRIKYDLTINNNSNSSNNNNSLDGVEMGGYEIHRVVTC